MTDDKSKSIGAQLMGGMGMSDVRLYGTASANEFVIVQDWLACTGTNGFVLSCTVNAHDKGTPMKSD